MPASPEAFEAPTLQSAFDQFGKNFGPLFVMFLISRVFAAIGYVVYIAFNLSALYVVGEDNGFLGRMTGRFLGEAGKMPFAIMAGFFSVMIAAIPAVYFATAETVTIDSAFKLLFGRPWRFLLAGLLFSIVSTVGAFACILPGIAVSLTFPIYVNRIFTTEQPIVDAFVGSFSALYGAEKGWSFIGLQVLIFMIMFVLTICTCGVGAIVCAAPSCFYLQNAAYRWGLIS